jgi:drug/metabolite transporter (DMT)-like permease
MVNVFVWVALLNIVLLAVVVQDSRGRMAPTVNWAIIVAVSGVLGTLLYYTIADREWDDPSPRQEGWVPLVGGIFGIVTAATVFVLILYTAVALDAYEWIAGQGVLLLIISIIFGGVASYYSMYWYSTIRN